ncbi:c-type cytochrome [Undibacterium arcticum]|uniref:c-type cytochrome n=1 Tax=Undibacterium arcticum TaxID=1762892 RepID=UPI003621C0C7
MDQARTSCRRAAVVFAAAAGVALSAGFSFAQPAPAPAASTPAPASISASIPDTIAQRLLACTACHGKEGRAASDGYYPRIAGKPDGYLYNQLLNFREGRRQYRPMIYLVDHLPDAYLREIAVYFSSQHPPYPPPQRVNVSDSVMERGKQLVINGDASNVPACAACHGSALTGVLPSTPALIGLPRDYINAQFGAWRNGTRRAHAPDCMAQIAERLSRDDISAASAWLASQPLAPDLLPAAASGAKLPLACGSVPQ